MAFNSGWKEFSFVFYFLLHYALGNLSKYFFVKKVWRETNLWEIWNIKQGEELGKEESLKEKRFYFVVKEHNCGSDNLSFKLWYSMKLGGFCDFNTELWTLIFYELHGCCGFNNELWISIFNEVLSFWVLVTNFEHKKLWIQNIASMEVEH